MNIMPAKPHRPCRHNGCPQITQDKGGYCDRHKDDEKKKRQAYDRKRGTSAKRGYGRRWRKLRAMKLANDPLCECGCEEPADTVHHRDGNEQNNSWENLMSVTHGCHNRIHNEQGERWG